MTLQADILYLPILSPVRVEVESHGMARQHTAPRQTWQPRLYRLPESPPVDGIAYGPGAELTMGSPLGRIIDLFV